MRQRQKLSSLSIFMPFFNDEGTVFRAIVLAYAVGHQVTDDLEVIAIHGGRSRDKTWQALQVARRKFPKLRLINKVNNKIGYAVIKYGFATAKKDWVFYTDGDLQYDLRELNKLVVAQLNTGADVINGYKLLRAEGGWRELLGESWSWFITRYHRFPIRDIDCDFRLIRRSFLQGAHFSAMGAEILEELITHLQKQGARFVEIPVAHYPRQYGHSNYSIWELINQKLRALSTKLEK